MLEKNKIIVILGRTASGKSDLAVSLASKFDGEVISADSRQVYKGLDIGTGKITKKEMRGIKHHLLDVTNPKKRFTVSQYLNLANKSIEQIIRKNKIPIVCGGTGFYIDALLGEREIPEVEPNKKLRKELEGKSTEALFKILQKLDPERAKNIDSQNPRRLVRAIEICKAIGKVPKIQKQKSNYQVLKIGLKIEDDKLKNRINKRLDQRIKKGMIAEAKRLHKNGLSYKRMREFGLEYRALADLLEGKISRKEMLERLKKEIWHYSKRQMVWFKRDKNIVWFSLSKVEGLPKISDVQKEVENFLKK